MLGSTTAVADGVTMLSEFPRHAVNAYLVAHPESDALTLVDAGTRLWGRRLVRRVAAADGELEAHVLTHAHPDHQGTSAQICERFGVPLRCHADDREAMETGRLPPADAGAGPSFVQRLIAGPTHPVDETIAEGDEVAGFEVIATPGHTPGHISLWRERDGVLIAGDAVLNMDLRTTLVGLHQPARGFSSDRAEARRSMRTVADLEPDTVLFGHGPPLEDGEELERFVAGLE